MNTNITKVPLSELEVRMSRFRAEMDKSEPQWELAVIFSKINLYYFTGTMPEGMLIIPRDDEPVFWVRKSYDRASEESLFPTIKPMQSFREAAASMALIPETAHIETEIVPVAFLQRFQKYFPIKSIKSVDRFVNRTRSIKSDYELALIKASGEIHRRVLEDIVPMILKEGMSELELSAELFKIMLNEGHHGISRFGMFDTEMGLGQLGFGESSIYPTYFNGPGGNFGLCPAVPILGSRENKLKNGDLVFIDIGCGVEGYHTDKTMTYMFGKPLSEKAVDAHKKCVDIQNRIADMLKPGNTPAEIYKTIMNSLDEEFMDNFMGFGRHKVKFLGHGIGLQIDEMPVIAEGFTEPLEAGMVFAVEPKKGIAGVGMVGIENTFMVTKNGGHCLTGKNPGLIEVY